MTVTTSKVPAIAVAALACAALLSGCKTGGSATPTTGQTAVPAPTSAVSSPTEVPAGLPHSGAPKVQNPLPALVFDQPPCESALTTKQLDDLLGTAPTGKPEELATGPTCHWSKRETGALITVGYGTKVPDGLSAAYKNVAAQATYWKPMPDVQGFPNVAYSTTSDGPPDDMCSLGVGIADNLGFYIGVTIGRNKQGQVDPCEATRMVADMVLTNLKGAS